MHEVHTDPSSSRFLDRQFFLQQLSHANDLKESLEEKYDGENNVGDFGCKADLPVMWEEPNHHDERIQTFIADMARISCFGFVDVFGTAAAQIC